MKRWVIFLIVAVIFVIGGAAIVKLRKHQLESIRIETKLPVPVNTVKIKKGTFKEERLYIGVLKSNKQAVVRARIQGQVSGILKREGDYVKKGQVVIELDGLPSSSFGTRKSIVESIKSQKRAIADMEKTIENLRKIYQRDLKLFENKAISKQALELSENRLKQAEVQLSSLKIALSNLKEKLAFFSVVAPFSGVISRIMVNVGDVIMPSLPLFEMENKDSCKLSASVSSDDIPYIKEGSEAEVLYGDKTLPCVVSRVFPSVKDTGVGTVEIYFDSHPFNLPLGSKISVKIPVRVMEDVLLVPDNGVLTSSANSVVFKIVDGKVEPVKVKILGASENAYAIEGNVKDGDTVVAGSDSLLMRLEKGTEVLTDKGE